jgi:hypothetical protein
MICIFCKHNSDASRSIEHLIPESLGNEDHALPPGIVCDGCNKYFAIKIEKPLLDTTYFRDLRYRKKLANKKGHSPSILGVHLQSLSPVDLFPDMNGSGASIAATFEKDEKLFIQSMRTLPCGTLVVPVPTEPDRRLFSRFLAKVAIEAMALRLLDSPLGLQEIVDKKEFDPLRNYARRGLGTSFWDYHRRVIYSPDSVFVESDGKSYEVLHEWTFLYTQTRELYFVLALFGMEYAINLGGPFIEGYENWLSCNDYKSPLYPK